MRQGAWCQKVEIWGVREINLHCCGHTRMAATQRCFGEVFGWAHAPPHPWGLALGILPYTGTKRPKAEVPLLVGVLKQIIARVKVVYQINLFCPAGGFLVLYLLVVHGGSLAPCGRGASSLWDLPPRNFGDVQGIGHWGQEVLMWLWLEPKVPFQGHEGDAALASSAPAGALTRVCPPWP